jgi:enoyl-CoA hydratase/carnithine racemase
MPHPHLTVETSPDGYRCPRLARPERRNALDLSLLRAVTDALACEPEAPVVLGSTDPRVFCAAAGLAGRGAGVKAVMAADGLLDRMRAERAANRSAWARAMALPPGP